MQGCNYIKKLQELIFYKQARGAANRSSFTKSELQCSFGEYNKGSDYYRVGVFLPYPDDT